MTFAKRYADFVARLRVPSGFLLVAAFGWLAAPTPASLAPGLAVAVLGLLLRGWAAGHLDKNRKLAESGPYAFVRNPLYLGTLTTALGLALAARRWELAVLFAAVFLGIYLPVIANEESHLRRLFPDYADYCRRVPALVPRWNPARSRAPFRWALYRQNEEYQALLGFLAGAAWLLWRSRG
jgi:protein-S-isoprenylcysteine O-methyltransferase Ste14